MKNGVVGALSTMILGTITHSCHWAKLWSFLRFGMSLWPNLRIVFHFGPTHPFLRFGMSLRSASMRTMLRWMRGGPTLGNVFIAASDMITK